MRQAGHLGAHYADAPFFPPFFSFGMRSSRKLDIRDSDLAAEHVLD